MYSTCEDCLFDTAEAKRRDEETFATIPCLLLSPRPATAHPPFVVYHVPWRYALLRYLIRLLTHSITYPANVTPELLAILAKPRPFADMAAMMAQMLVYTPGWLIRGIIPTTTPIETIKKQVIHSVTKRQEVISFDMAGEDNKLLSKGLAVTEESLRQFDR